MRFRPPTELAGSCSRPPRCGSRSRRRPGLHHPIRAERALTYAPDSPRATMHGFLNVFAAAAFAWHGMDWGTSSNCWRSATRRRSNSATTALLWNDHRAHHRPDRGRAARVRAQFRLVLVRRAGHRIAGVGTAAMIDHTHDPELKSWVESANDPATRFPDPESAVRDVPAERRAAFAPGRRDRRPDPRRDGGVSRRVDARRHGDAARAASGAAARSQRIPGAGTRTAREAFLTPMADARAAAAVPRSATTRISTRRSTTRGMSGSMFRPDNPLLPNYKWVPVGYHGRASSVVVSGTPVRRPCGQISERPAGRRCTVRAGGSITSWSSGAFLGPGNRARRADPDRRRGRSPRRRLPAERLVGARHSGVGVPAARAVPGEEFRDVDLAVRGHRGGAGAVPLRARTARARAIPSRCRICSGGAADAYDIQLEVWLRSARMAAPVRVSRTNFRSMYWTLAQMIAHHTSNGCNVRPGDLIGSGTVSGPEKENRGCLLELTWKGTEPLELPTGEIAAISGRRRRSDPARLVRGCRVSAASGWANAGAS